MDGPAPILIEWDSAVPDWDTLAGEAHLADAMLRQSDLGG